MGGWGAFLARVLELILRLLRRRDRREAEANSPEADAEQVAIDATHATQHDDEQAEADVQAAWADWKREGRRG